MLSLAVSQLVYGGVLLPVLLTNRTWANVRTVNNSNEVKSNVVFIIIEGNLR